MLDTAGKDCLICGQCCAHKPRVRDTRGNYYCKVCYAEVIKRRGFYDPELSSHVGGSFAPISDEIVSEILSELSENDSRGRAVGAHRGSETATAEDERVPKCLNCDRPIDPGSQICIGCGCTLRTATINPAAIAAQVASARRTRTAHRSLIRDGVLTPLVIGSASIAVALIDVLVHGLGLLMHDFGGERDDIRMIGRVIGASLGIVFAIWLGFGAVMLLRSRPSSESTLRRWAVTKLALFAALFITALVIQLWLGASDRAPDIRLPSGWLLVVFAMNAVWTLAWAVFILKWLQRHETQVEFARWRITSRFRKSAQ